MRKAFSRKFVDMVQGNLVSRVFGFLREVVVAFYFGASRATDIFAIAFTIPTLFRRVLGEDMVEKAFLPAFRQLIAARQYRRAWILASRLFNIMLLLLVIIMGVFYLLTPRLVRVLGAGLGASELHQAEVMTYLILPFMVAIGLASFVGGLLLFLDATAGYALAPVMLSVGVVLGVVALTPYLGMYSMAVGFVLGGMLMFLFQIPMLIRASRRTDLGLRYIAATPEATPELREVGRQSGWIFLQSLSSKTVEVVDRILASFLVPGSIAALYFAQRLVQLPNAIIGLAVGRAGVTELNDQAQQGNWYGFRTTVVTGLRYNIVCMLPLTAFLLALSGPITSMVFQRGAFDQNSVTLTAFAFSFYSLGLLGMGLWGLYSRVYPALAKNQVPLYCGLLGGLVNVGLSILLVRTSLRHGGLALASSIAFTLNGGLLFAAFNSELRRLGERKIGWQDVGNTVLSIGVASAAGGLTARLLFPRFSGMWVAEHLPQLLFNWGALLALGLAAACGLVTFLATLGYYTRLRGTPGDEGERVILTGGGTGGHVNPALAIAEALKQRNPDTRFLYVGVRGRAESVIVARAGYPIRYVHAWGFPGWRPSGALLRFGAALLVGVVQSVYLIATFRPQMIIGTGGYVSAPVIFANTLMRLLGMSRARVFIHEQNSVPGKLNRFIGRRADKVLLTFPQTRSYFPGNAVVVGYPVRQSLTGEQSGPARASESVPLHPGRRVVFVFGGSQGARTINRAVVDALGYLVHRRQDIFIVHGVGLMNGPDYRAWEDTCRRLSLQYSPEQREEMTSFYYARDYFHNIGDIYAKSDLVVCRGGAGSLSEISAMGKPALIIPKANLPGEHQVMNARAMRRAGAAEVIYEDTVMEDGVLLEKVEGRELADKILALLDSPERLAEIGERALAFMRRDVPERIADEIYGNPVSQQVPDDGRGVASDSLLSNTQLLELLRHAWQKHQNDFGPAAVLADADDLDYYRHRAASLLTSPSWPERNLGVKLIGLLKHEEKLPSLLHLLGDRTPAGRVQRVFGGDYRQVGFIRRNILISLQVMDTWDPEVERQVFRAFGDGYYEVRAQAARTAGHFAQRLIDRQAAAEKLLALLDDCSFEVVREAALALGVVGTEPGVAEALFALRENRYWQVRDAALRAVASLVERGIVTDHRWVREELSRFILSTTDFRPHFRLKDSYRHLVELCREQEPEGTEAAE
jgi:UDP-N-acetylglucosamine--N-acetylmuramyl-(pentapeptide) pyrophosphoryl-undecaprenol N-acetylglucosamine transferase